MGEGTTAMPVRCATCGLEITGTMVWHQSDQSRRYCQRCGIPKTPPARRVEGWVIVDSNGTPWTDTFQPHPALARSSVAMRDADFANRGFRVVPATLTVHEGPPAAPRPLPGEEKE